MTTSTGTSVLDAALELAAAGWLLFPLQGKAPAIPREQGGTGFHDASTDPAQLEAWWHRWPAANIGIAVPPGTVVVDVDPRHGGEQTLAELGLSTDLSVKTLTTITGAGGRHYWFSGPPGLLQHPLGPGLDVRVGGKGYVVAPPSIHAETGSPYRWVEPFLARARLPFCVEHRLHPAPMRTDPPRLQVLQGGQSVLVWATERLTAAAPGTRHETLRNTAILLGGYVSAGRLTQLEAEDCLSRVTSGLADGGEDRGHYPRRVALRPRTAGVGVMVPQAPPTAGVGIRWMADVKSKRIEYVWRGRIARGKLTAIGGDPGAGKGTLGIEIASHISTGRDWPDGQACPMGRVLLLTGEDNPEDTINPRLEVAEADRSRVGVVTDITTPEGERRRVRLDTDAELLMSYAAKAEAAVIIIDPISSYLGADVNSWRDSDMRRVLDHIANNCQNCAQPRRARLPPRAVSRAATLSGSGHSLRPGHRVPLRHPQPEDCDLREHALAFCC